MAAAAMSKIERAHRMYREGCHEVALGLYTDALAMAKTKAQKIALHSNRAACYLKLHDFKKAAEECTSVLELDHQHTGALMLRAQTLVTLKDYQSALFDVNRLMELNPLSDVYRNLQARLKTQLSLAPIPESEEEAPSLEEIEEEAQPEGTRTQSEEERKVDPADEKPEAPVTQPANTEEASANTSSKPQGWEAIPKPKGHSGLDYSRWDRVEDDSSEEEQDDKEDQQPQYKFRVRTVGVFDTRATMFTSSTGVFKSKGRCLRKTLTKVTGTDDVDPPQTSCRSFNRLLGHILIEVVLRHKQHAGHRVLTPIDSLSWGVLYKPTRF